MELFCFEDKDKKNGARVSHIGHVAIAMYSFIFGMAREIKDKRSGMKWTFCKDKKSCT